MPLRLLLLLALLALLACTATPSSTPNRDRHGPADVARYIQGLESEGRVRELDPAGVIRTLGIALDSVAADVGCGPGVFTLPLARHLIEGLVYAVDVEPRQLDALRVRLASNMSSP